MEHSPPVLSAHDRGQCAVGAGLQEVVGGQVDCPHPRPKLRLRVAHGGGDYHVVTSGDVAMPGPQETVVPVAMRGRGAGDVMEHVRLSVNSSHHPTAD